MPVTEVEVGRSYIWDPGLARTGRMPVFVPTQEEAWGTVSGFLFHHAYERRAFVGTVSLRELEEA